MAKNKPEGSKYNRTYDSKSKGMMCLIVIFAIVAAVMIGVSLIPTSSDVAETTIITDSTAITFNVIDPYDASNEDIDDAQVYVYLLDTTEWTTSQLVDVDDARDDFSEYTLDSTKDWDDASIEIADGEYYLVEINMTGYSPVFMSSFYSEALGFPQTMSEGVNNVYLVNQSESYAVIANGINLGSGAVADTTETEWRITIVARDADDDMTRTEGYRTYTDFKTLTENRILLAITFNTTAESDWVELTSSGIEDIGISTTVLYIEISNVMFSGEISYSIEIDSGIGTDFELVTIAAGIGSIGDGLTTTFATIA